MTAPAAHVARVALTDFRCFTNVEVELGEGLTVVHGPNGQGKTSLLEGLAWPARARSIRGVPDAALVRAGTDAAVVRCEIREGTRTQSFAAEIHATGRNRLQLNGNTITRHRDLFGVLRVTVFTPDDLELVKAGPALRREYLDQLLEMLAPRYVAATSDFDRVLRQRNALLKSAAREGLDATTLAVFDEQLVSAGGEVVRGRLQLLTRLVEPAREAMRALGDGDDISFAYVADWGGGELGLDDLGSVEDRLREGLATLRRRELERQMTLVGPHRDELRMRLSGLEARTQASQGEQRSLALALRLAGHRVVTELTDSVPVLLLDDVFSELDARRSAVLIGLLPPGQTLLTTATAVPSGVRPTCELLVQDAKVVVA